MVALYNSIDWKSTTLHMKPELELFGFRFSDGAHISKTMMLKEISNLILNSRQDAKREDYLSAVVTQNILSKETQSTRKKTYVMLRRLYGLDVDIPLFQIYRKLMYHDPTSAPQLSFLASWARDPLLRISTPVVMSHCFGARVTTESIRQAIAKGYPDIYSASSLGTASRNIASTWAQSGHLYGKSEKVRIKTNASAASITLALVLGHIDGYDGEALFTCPYIKLLDLSKAEAKNLTALAHKENLLTYRTIADIIEISFAQYNAYLGEIE